MSLEEDYGLSNGVAIPKLGLGTWMTADDLAPGIIREAVKVGYRHFDTAQAYGNERGVGEGVRSCGVPRDKLFVTTKLDAACKVYEDAKARIEGSLAALGLDYIDLMLIHSPQPWTEFHQGEHYFDGNLQAWRALEDAYKAGKLRAIGVSNFEEIDLQNILEHGSIKPMVNQILTHVGSTPLDLIAYTQSQGILVEAYSPVAHGKIFGSPVLNQMAEAYKVTVAQICIRYCLQLGLLPLPKTVTPAHMRSNAAVDFEISAADMEVLKTMSAFDDYGDAARFPVFGPNKRTKTADARRD